MIFLKYGKMQGSRIPDPDFYRSMRKALSKRWKIAAAWARFVWAMGTRVSAVMPLTICLLTAQLQASTAKGGT